MSPLPWRDVQLCDVSPGRDISVPEGGSGSAKHGLVVGAAGWRPPKATATTTSAAFGPWGCGAAGGERHRGHIGLRGPVTGQAGL